MSKRMPRLPESRRPAWSAINAAAQYAADVMAYARVGDTAGAWRAVAAATYWCGAAEEQLRSEVRKALGQKKGGEPARAKAAADRQRCRDICASGEWSSLDNAAIAIAPQVQLEFSTVRRYLKGMGKT
jgi:hypothetical protein